MRTPLSVIALSVLVSAPVLMLRAQQQAPAAPAQVPPAPQASQPSGPPPPAPGPPPVTFRVQIDYVEVDAIVTDKQGNPVRDLRRDDFEVLEDNAPQKIDLFTHVDLPVTKPEQPLFSPTPIEPDVQVNTSFEGRMYVLLLDDLHTYAPRTGLVRRAARQFIERNMGANDLAAVVQVSGRTNASQDFTSNKRLLLAAVDKFIGQRLQSSYATRMDEYYRTRDNPNATPDRIKDPEEYMRVYNARAAMDTVRNVATFLEGVRGRRKAVLLFSEGIDFDIYDVFNHPDATTVTDSVRSAIASATRANVALYTIDPRGLTTLGDESIEVSGVPPDDPAYAISKTELQDALQRSQDSLRVLAEQTGGYAAVNTNDFRGAFDRIVTENSSYYVLGYYPTNEKRDGRFRKIEVRVKRPDVEVKSRKGYVAPRGKPEPPKVETSAGTSPELREALNSPVPENGLAMALNATAFKGEAPKASVLIAVQVDGRRFKFTEKDGQFFDKLELSMLALDEQGKIQGGDRENIELKLRPQTRQAVELAGFRALTRLSLAPGRYQIRVGARAVNADVVGSVYYDLVVPDFSKEPFAMSGLVLTSTLAGFTPTARVDQELKDVLKGPPTTVREFSVAETMAVFAEVYVNKVPTAHAVDITTTMRAADGRTVFKTEETRSTDELQGARGGFGYIAQIPLKDIAPGEYVLRVEARSRLSGVEPIARETMVRLWPVPQRAPATAQQGTQQQGRIIVRVDGGARSTLDDFETVVARNEEQWQALWGRLPARRAAPKVMFENTMIVAVFLGNRPSAGYSVDIVGLARDGDALVVQYAERVPAAGVASADVITTPYVIAGVPRHDGEVRFEKVDAPPRP